MKEEEDIEVERVPGYVPPFIKYGGYHFGALNHKSNGCVHHSIYLKEIQDRRAETGEDWNGSRAGTLMTLLLNRHEDKYEGWEYDRYCIRPYCWCEKDGCPWCEGTRPYFIDRLSGLNFRWYKHPFRGFEASEKYMASDIDQMAKEYGVSLDREHG